MPEREQETMHPCLTPKPLEPQSPHRAEQCTTTTTFTDRATSLLGREQRLR
jgi:hypothetical protein